MILTQPIWLVLVIPLGLAWWAWPAPTRSLRVVRAVLLGLIVAAMAGPALRLPEQAGTVVVLADRSRSMPADADARQREALDLLHRARGEHDRLGVVSFGQGAVVERPPDLGSFDGFTRVIGTDASALSEAIDRALSLAPAGEPARLLILSDGLWTGADPRHAAGRAAARGVAIDHRLIERGRANDLAIQHVDAPRQVNRGESFMLHAQIRSPRAQPVSYVLYRDGQPFGRGEARVPAGVTRLTFRDQAEQTGVYRYELRLDPPEDDPVPENNQAGWLIDVAGPRPILLVTDSPDGGLARLLAAGGIDVRSASPESVDWSLAQLDGFAAVVIENVPARSIPQAAMRTISGWVQRHGGGLLMTGGERSFGPGGYFQSPLADALPVSMELRQEHRKLAMAIVVTMDRSGSMQAPVSGGRTKMDLANMGAARVLDGLTALDEFGVIAVDTTPHVIVPLAPTPANPAALRDRVLRIASTGGGIYIEEALLASYDMLRRASAGTRHLILFADAADSVQEGRYRDLLDGYQRDGITVSVIGMGSPADKDAALLEDIARRGGGRSYFTTDPNQLPELFAQDMVMVERNTFIRDLTPTRPAGGMAPLVGRMLDQVPAVGGYNLTYLREGAAPAIVTTDEYAAPLIATWQAGLGRAATYAGEADGEYTGPIGQWEHIGQVMTSLVRWTAGESEPLPDGMMLRQTLERGAYRVSLELDPFREAGAAPQPATLQTLHDQPDGEPRSRRTTVQWESADVMAARIDLADASPVLTQVSIPGYGRFRLPPVMRPYSPEFAPGDADGRLTLTQVASITGGEQRVDLGSIWSALERTPRDQPIGHWLAMAAILLLLLEVADRRTGLLAGLIRRRHARAPGPDARAASDLSRRPSPGGPLVQPGQDITPPASPSPSPGKSAEGSPAKPTPSPRAPSPGAPQPGLGAALARARSQADQRTGRK